MTNFLTGMKHKFRDLIILLISYSGLSYLYRVYVRRRGPLVRVLCFHEVSDTNWFETVVKMISKNYHLLTPEDFKAKKFSEEKINVLLTFDDGYQSWIDNCLPVLNAYQAKGLFFINSGLLDSAENDKQTELYMKERLLISPKKPLTWEGAKVLAAGGHTIGGHTTTHPNLAKLSMGVARAEIIDDKIKIELKLGVAIEDFAYPFGTLSYISKELISFVETVYSYQYSAITGFIQKAVGDLIPRTLIEKNQPLWQIKSWIEGSYDLFSDLK